MTGALSGRMARADPEWYLERRKFEAGAGTVFVLDRALSVLMLDVDPGEGCEMLLPVRGRVEDVSVRMIEEKE